MYKKEVQYYQYHLQITELVGKIENTVLLIKTQQQIKNYNPPQNVNNNNNDDNKEHDD